MAFFDEATVRAEAAELFDLYQSMMRLSVGGLYGMEQKQEYLDNLKRIIEIQKIMHFRAKYSDEPDADDFVGHLKTCSEVLGYKGNVDEVFLAMEADLNRAQEVLNEES